MSDPDPDPNGACACGGTHTEGHVYFVTARYGAKTTPLLGPFTDHPAALGKVALGRRLANEVDHRAPWYSFGTVGVPGVLGVQGHLNDLASVVEQREQEARAASPKRRARAARPRVKLTSYQHAPAGSR
jgi:hypothetical protein